RASGPDGGLREADLDPERVQLVAEEPEAAKRGEQRNPRDRRREDERELDQSQHGASSREAPARKEIGGRRAEDEHGYGGDQARLQADDKRVARHLVVELREELPDRNPEEDRHDRQKQEDERHGC